MATKKPTDSKKNILAPLKIKTVEKPVKTGDVVTINVEGDYASRYNEASAICKGAEALMKELKPAMLPLAVSEIFTQNTTNPNEPIVSVAFRDEKDNVLRISLVNKFGNLTVPAVEALFKGLKTKDNVEANINNYLARTVEAKFDSAVFKGADGKFDKERYDKIVTALDGVSKELGVANPLSTQIAVEPMPNFSTRRWLDFDLAANLLISKVITNQVTFTPCPNAVTGLMAGEEPKEEKE